MRSYAAVTPSETVWGGLATVLAFAKRQSNMPVPIFSARAGEKQAKVVLEVDGDVVRVVPNGRTEKLKRLKSNAQ